ncbi:hypothetical protein HK097_003816 [Rhizophlyctis rosea]|uniref:Uncharacterized protein n=1 Tax=Rhizophlyctis rosea TaxID=64517 RepID=A0AAD5SFQ2_9FUNG|nr:hypothetical protein HK097_003816 [Rhizophlyctis rosea]
MSKGKGPSIMELDDDDIDNMDFDLPDDTQLSPSQQSQLQSFQPPPGAPGFGGFPGQPSQADVAAIKEKTKKWTCIYPLYIDRTKPKRLGRKLPSHQCHQTPTAIYMLEALRLLSIPTVFEPTARHPADPFTFGRLKVQLRDPETRKPLNPEFKTRLQLLKKVAEMLDECERTMKERDPTVAVMAANSRSQISKEVVELAKTLEKEKEGVAQPVKKKDKKKKK